MQALTLAMIAVVTTGEFLVDGDYWGRWAILPGFVKYLPELLGLIAAVVVVLAGTRNRFRFVRPQYWLVFGAFAIVISCGAFANSVEPGPVFAGIRNYLRAIAWFLVPAVYAYEDRELRTQMRLLAVVAILQVPFAVQQRLATTGQGSTTGDFTTGTLLISSIMSIFLICCMGVTAALVARRKMAVKQFVLLTALMFLPTTINETKGTLVLLPIALSFALLAAAKPGRRLRAALMATGLVATLGAVFFPVYDYYQLQRRYSVPLSEFLTDPERLERYLWSDQDVGATRTAGRVDSIVVPLTRLAEDPVQLAFGYGIGNVSESALGHAFVGEYFEIFAPFLTTAFSRVLLETGVLGAGLVFLLLWLIYKDAWVVARRRDDVIGAFAAGWVGVTVVMGVCMFYKDVIAHASLSFLFWYFSGLIAAARMRATVGTERVTQPLQAMSYAASNRGT